MNTLLDIPKGAEVIDVCKAVEEMMNESEERGELRMLIKNPLIRLLFDSTGNERTAILSHKSMKYRLLRKTVVL